MNELRLSLGFPVFESELLPAETIRFDGKCLIVGKGTDMALFLYRFNLTPYDREFLKALRISVTR
jgi:hypothetical protein